MKKKVESSMNLEASAAFVVADSLCRGARRIALNMASQLRRRDGLFEGRRRLILVTLVATFVVALGAPSAFATDDHNPIGVAGVFEGMITTGCAYNVVNHNARREIDDIVVPSAVGKYGLKMTRYYNSRRTSSYLLMGPGWGHEYLWTSVNNERIDYPNGDVWDSHCTGDWAVPGPLGISDWPTSWNGYPAFRLADGGMVVFENPSWGVATKIIDPYGQIIAITLDGSGRITQVTEPGGRYLKFFYQDPDVSGLLTKVDAHGLGNATVTDSVVYHYQPISPGGQGQQPLKCLTQVDYSDGQHAYYYYDQDNAPDHPYPCPCSIKAFPVLIGCDDVRYRGPMRRIAYEYQDQGPHGAILKERYFDGVDGHERNGAMVSRIDPPAPSPLDTEANFDTMYTEYRGDGPTRTFNYTPCTWVGTLTNRAQHGAQTQSLILLHSSSCKATQIFSRTLHSSFTTLIGILIR